MRNMMKYTACVIFSNWNDGKKIDEWVVNNVIDHLWCRSTPVIDETGWRSVYTFSSKEALVLFQLVWG